MSAPTLPANQILATIGVGSFVSALGRQEAHRAAMIQDPNLVGFAAADAKLVTIDPDSPPESPVFKLSDGETISLGQIEERWGNRLRENMGIRFLKPEQMSSHLLSDIGAPLAHDLENGVAPGGLRDHGGLTESAFKGSALKDMRLLFNDDAETGLSLQSQLFVYTTLMALGSLSASLSSMIPAHRFRVGAGACFSGQESYHALGKNGIDLFAYRLASVLCTHGPGLINMLLSPALSLSKVQKNLELLDLLKAGSGYLRNVPQAPLVSSAACASALCTFCDVVPSMLWQYPGVNNVDVLLWTSADTAMRPDARVLEGFGPGAMMTRQKLEQTGRHVSEGLFPLDADAAGKIPGTPIPLGGTTVSHGGYSIPVMTPEFIFKLIETGVMKAEDAPDITALIPGWGQSGESGGKQHAAGVGFGGENATISALMMAYEGHGLTVDDFDHLIGHLTGTSVNSKSDLSTYLKARKEAADAQGLSGPFLKNTVGAPKAAGAAHPMGPAGHLGVQEGIYYVNGEPTVGIPTLKTLDPSLAQEAEQFEISVSPIRGSRGKGVVIPVQGFAGYDACVALYPANPEVLRRYPTQYEKGREAFIEAWPEIRRRRIARDARLNRTLGSAFNMIFEHRWPGAK